MSQAAASRIPAFWRSRSTWERSRDHTKVVIPWRVLEVVISHPPYLTDRYAGTSCAFSLIRISEIVMTSIHVFSVTVLYSASCDSPRLPKLSFNVFQYHTGHAIDDLCRLPNMLNNPALIVL